MHSGVPSGGNQTGETEGKGSRPGYSEAPGHFFRKRKRGYHRAYDRGEKSYEVLRFMCTIQSRRMINDLNKKFFAPQMKAELEKPLGLLSLISDEENRRGGKIFNVADSSDHVADALRYSMMGVDYARGQEPRWWQRILRKVKKLWR